MQRKWRLAAAAAALLALLGAAVIAGLAAALPDTLYTDEPAAELRIASLPYLSARKSRRCACGQHSARHKQQCYAGIVRRGSGQNGACSHHGAAHGAAVRYPFGVKLFSDGALVVAFSDRYTALSSENPAKAAGLRLGDLIISANGQPVRSNEDLTSAIQAAGGAPLTVLTDAAKANVRRC